MIALKSPPIDQLTKAVFSLESKLPEFQHNLWKKQRGDELFKKLAIAITSSQTHFQQALNFIDANYSIIIGESNGEFKNGIRFQSKKIEYIRRTKEEIDSLGGIIKFLNKSLDPIEARERLIQMSAGIGPKQASFFLVSIGWTNQLAILDRHILNFMRLINLIKWNTSIQRLSEYVRVEQKFIEMCRSFNKCPFKFDLAIWIVMREWRKLNCH